MEEEPEMHYEKSRLSRDRYILVLNEKISTVGKKAFNNELWSKIDWFD